MQLSVVTTLYNSSPFLEALINELKKTIENIGIKEFEIIMVNDGSPDNSLEKAKELKQNHPEIVIINLSRNFGHHYALMAGIEHSKGDLVFLIDSDMEVHPRVLEDFYHIYTESKGAYDVVYGYQSSHKRKDKILDKLYARLFWKLYHFLTGNTCPHENPLTERLMNRHYVNALISCNDKNIFIGGLFDWVGFNQYGIEITRNKNRSKSTYSLRKRISLFIDAITSLSAFPLKIIFYIGLLITFICMLAGTTFVAIKIAYPKLILPGYTSVITAIFFSLGINMFTIGWVGIYVEKVYNQTKNRPRYIVKEIIY